MGGRTVTDAGAAAVSAEKVAPEYEPLRSVAAKYGATCSPDRFYWEVNDAFHTAEASLYDDVHAGMFLGGEPMWQRLFDHLPDRKLDILDVGCGTGLVGEYLFKLAPEKVGTLTMLDPNRAMLERTVQRSQKWPVVIETVQGDISAVAGRQFDVITVSSVMHHVVEIAQFCAALRDLLRPGGFLFQMQDPRDDAKQDTVLAQRQEASRALRKPSAYRQLRSLAGKALNALGRTPKPDPIEAGTNEQLLSRGIISKPIPKTVIWSITDFHVPGQENMMGHGFSREQLGQWLTPMRNADYFRYEFHGMAWDSLNAEERRKETELWESNSPHGNLFGSAWQKPQ